MPKTLVSDVIVPEQFAPYVRIRAMAMNKFARAGIIEDSPEFDALAQRGGRSVKMPFWNPLVGQRQVLSDLEGLSVGRITSGQDAAWIQNDGNGWSVNSLAKYLAGEDPLKAIIGAVGDFWALEDERFMVATLRGVFAAPTMASNILKIAVTAKPGGGYTDAQTLNGKTFIDATTKLGEHGDKLGSIVMHSYTEASLRKLDLIQFLPASEGKPMLRLFQGRVVVVDDNLPMDVQADGSMVFTSYLFGPGAFARGEATLSGSPLKGEGTEALEFQRDASLGDTEMYMRRRYILHPRGVQFLGRSVAKDSPDNAELSDPQNWERAYQDPKLIRIVAIEHNVVLPAGVEIAA